MPGFNHTGPRGDGPMSGKVQGICDSARSGRMQEASGGYNQGRGRGRGGGFRCGWGNRPGRRGGVGLQGSAPRTKGVKE